MGTNGTGRRQAGDGHDDVGGAHGAPKDARGHRRYTPEQRREAVEAFEKAGMSQVAFARTWGVSHVTLGQWLRRHAAEGGKGLERVAMGPPRRRGRAPLAAPVHAAIAAVQRRFPDFGLKRVRNFLRRFAGLKVSLGNVRKVRRVEGLPTAAPLRRRRRPAPPRRFERSRPGELWQSDITYLDVPWRRGPLYLIVFMDDHSRYVVGHGLFTHQRADIALDVFAEACAKFGKPKEVLTDQGRQYFAWRGKSAFQKMLAKEGVAHVVARAHHPETVGKCERFWETLKRELWDRVHPKDLDEARARVAHFVAHHNHQRPHQSLDGLVPADRFFGVESEVKKAVEAAIAKNELLLALGEAPRKPVYLVGQIDGQSVSLHGEQGRLVVETSDGERREIEAKDLGGVPQPKEKNDEQQRQRQQQDAGARGAGSDDGDEAAGPAPVPAGPTDPTSPLGAQAHEVRGADDADAGAGAMGSGQPGGADAGAPDRDRAPSHVAGQGDA
jgi:transposase InsO family protein/transposase-like protein